jgi:hypothetical protein
VDLAAENARLRTLRRVGQAYTENEIERAFEKHRTGETAQQRRTLTLDWKISMKTFILVVVVLAFSTASFGATQQGNLLWSGAAFYDPTGQAFKLEVVVSQFYVPTINSNTCLGNSGQTIQQAAAWSGLDGYNTTDVLQAGVVISANCSGQNILGTAYNVFYAWCPAAPIYPGTPRVKPGDLVFVSVWNTDATHGMIYICNKTTGSWFSAPIAAPPGSSITGKAVEWIVEAQSIGGKSKLPNFGTWVWTSSYAENYTSSNPTSFASSYTPPGFTGSKYVLQMSVNGYSAPWNTFVTLGGLQNMSFQFYNH